MNYITINIGGKERGWKVNQMTIELWSKYTLNDASVSTAMYAGVYSGLVGNCYVKREEPDFTFEDVCDWVDKLNVTTEGVKVLELVKKTFEESEAYIAVLERMKKQLITMRKAEEKTDKKKLKMK